MTTNPYKKRQIGDYIQSQYDVSVVKDKPDATELDWLVLRQSPKNSEHHTLERLSSKQMNLDNLHSHCT